MFHFNMYEHSKNEIIRASRRKDAIAKPASCSITERAERKKRTRRVHVLCWRRVPKRHIEIPADTHPRQLKNKVGSVLVTCCAGAE